MYLCTIRAIGTGQKDISSTDLRIWQTGVDILDAHVYEKNVALLFHFLLLSLMCMWHYGWKQEPTTASVSFVKPGFVSITFLSSVHFPCVQDEIHTCTSWLHPASVHCTAGVLEQEHNKG